MHLMQNPEPDGESCLNCVHSAHLFICAALERAASGDTPRLAIESLKYTLLPSHASPLAESPLRSISPGADPIPPEQIKPAQVIIARISLSSPLNDPSLTIMCAQFLPQDKVSSFARLKPRELLMETEKAIGGGELHVMHVELIELKVQLNRDTQVSDIHTRLQNPP